MKKLTILLVALFAVYNTYAQMIEVQQGKYKLDAQKRVQTQEENEEGLFIFESNLNVFPSEEEVIPLGTKGCPILMQIENRSDDSIRVTRMSFSIKGSTYPIEKFTYMGVACAVNLRIVRDGDMMHFYDDNTILGPREGLYNWVFIHAPKKEDDASTGSLQFVMLDTNSVEAFNFQGQKIVPANDFPLAFWKRWIGAKTTWLDPNPTGVEDKENLELQLSVYPNPFMDQATLNFTLKNQEYLSVEIVDIQGRTISHLVEADFSAGNHELNFSSGNLSAGTYYLVVRGSKTRAFKLVRQ